MSLSRRRLTAVKVEEAVEVLNPGLEVCVEIFAINVANVTSAYSRLRGQLGRRKSLARHCGGCCCFRGGKSLRRGWEKL